MIQQTKETRSVGLSPKASIARMVCTFAFPLALATTEAAAQDTIWSMNECMQYAVEHSPKVKKQLHTDDTYRAESTAAVAALFPSVSVGSQGSFNFGRSIDPGTNTYNTVSTFNNSYSLSASMPLFDGGQLINQLKAARVNRNIGTTSIEKERDDLALSVMQAYIDVVYYSGTVKLAVERLKESHRVLYKTKRQQELGLKGVADVVQIESQVAGNDYTHTQQQNLLHTAMLTLKAHMNIPTETHLQIDTLLVDQVVATCDHSPEEIFNFATEHNPTARLATLKLKNAELQHLVNKGKLYPRISVSAGVSTNFFRNMNNEGNSAPTNPYFEQLSNNLGQYVSVSLSIPIFEGLGRITSVRRARNNRRIAQEDRTETFRQLQRTIEVAEADRLGYTKEVTQMQKKVESDELSYQITLRKFEEGLMSPLDLQLSSNNLLLSYADLLKRKLELIIKTKMVAYYSGVPLIETE